MFQEALENSVNKVLSGLEKKLSDTLSFQMAKMCADECRKATTVDEFIGFLNKYLNENMTQSVINELCDSICMEISGGLIGSRRIPAHHRVPRRPLAVPDTVVGKTRPIPQPKPKVEPEESVESKPDNKAAEESFNFNLADI